MRTEVAPAESYNLKLNYINIKNIIKEVGLPNIALCKYYLLRNSRSTKNDIRDWPS